MPFDGLFISALCAELKPRIIGARIDKIFQPEPDELSIVLRGQCSEVLFISAESSMPYFSLTPGKKSNPQAPPMFCMLLRKHLIGGRILKLEQRGMERVLTFTIEGKNEFGEPELKHLIVEIMGKHSNIILTRDDFRVIDSIKRITPDMSRVRVVLPGMPFAYLPSSKANAFDGEAALVAALGQMREGTPAYKALYGAVEGLSPIVAHYICSQAGVDSERPLAPEAHSKLAAAVRQVCTLPAPINGYIYSDADSKSVLCYHLDVLNPLYRTERFQDIFEAVNQFYASANHRLKMHQRALDLKKTVQQRIDRASSKIGKMQEERATAHNFEAYKQMGDLILSNAHTLSKGSTQATVENYYENPPTQVVIALDPRLDPIQNARQYFKKYTKLKTALHTLKTHIQTAENERSYLEDVLTHLNHTDDTQMIAAIRNELVEEGYLKRSKASKSKRSDAMPYRTFITPSGFRILVGKSNLQNDRLTLKVASKKDIWLHTKDIPGSHVIIRTEGRLPDDEAIDIAAHIAAYYSKARQSANVPVDYTQVKYVSKPSGAKPGMVIYTDNKTRFVTPDATKIEAYANGDFL